MDDRNSHSLHESSDTSHVSLARVQQMNSSPSNRNSRPHLPIISLSKLKNYMPKTRYTNQQVDIPHMNHDQQRQSPTITHASYRNKLLEPKSLGRTADNSPSQHKVIGSADKNLPHCAQSSDEQRKDQPSQSGNLITESFGRSRQLDSDISIGSSQHNFTQGPQNASPRSGEERKRKKISLGSNQGSIEAHKQQALTGQVNETNMTPSSLLLLQNHNYIEQEQHRSGPTAANCSSQSTLERQVDHRNCNNSSGSSRAMSDNGGRCDTGRAIKSSGEHEQQQLSNSGPILTPSSIHNSNSQFRLAPATCNTSCDSDIANPNNLPANSAILNSNDYQSNQILTSQNPSHLMTDSEIAPGNSVSNIQHNYQQHVNSSPEAKSSTSGGHYANYVQPDTRSQVSSYHPEFSASMFEQQIKLESIKNGRDFLDHNGTSPANHGGINHFTAARGLSQYQQRTGINHYYSNQYSNLMPAISSKSSSPASSNSSPSPKTKAMHPNTTHHSGQLGSASSASHMHIDNQGNQYIGGAMTAVTMNQHPVNQHYSYGHMSGSAMGQHHLTLNNRDQIYTSAPRQHSQHQLHHGGLPGIQGQSIYHHLTNTATNTGVNHIYTGNNGVNQYEGHHQPVNTGQSHNNLISSAHQNQLNSAAAACAAAVVSQTLKTVANQQHQTTHQYGSGLTNNFSANNGDLVDITSQHGHHIHPSNHQLGYHSIGNQIQSSSQQQTQNIPAHGAATISARKYQCKMCPQVFMSKAEMKYHNQNHMREAKPYKCLQCPKAFANSSYLSQHMRIHQGVKPYTCDICQRKFTQLSHLQQHKRTHTGDKPYKCNYINCTKQFSQLSNLQSHSRCHQLDKPYKCNSCYKCFHDEQSLLEHIPRHLESKHLKKNLCIFCGSSYQQERGLVKHFQQYHTDKPPTLVAAAIAAGTTGNTALIASLVSSTTQSNNFATPIANGTGSCGSNSSGLSNSSNCSSSSNITNPTNTIVNAGGQSVMSSAGWY